MTNEEIETFKTKIAEDFLPLVKNMNGARIKEVIDFVEKSNPDLPQGFGRMLYEQIMTMKNSSKYSHYLNN